MLSEGNIVRFTVGQILVPTGQTIINVFHYQAQDVTGSISTAGDFQQIITDFMLSVVATFSGVQSNTLGYQSTTYDDMTNLIDQAVYKAAAPTGGVVASPSEPGQVALSFKLIRSSRLTRNGSKRVGGIADSLIVDPKGNSLVTNVDVLAIEAALAAPVPIVISGGKGVTLVPVIAREPAKGLPITVFQEVAGAVYRGAGSQNSRKSLQ